VKSPKSPRRSRLALCLAPVVAAAFLLACGPGDADVRQYRVPKSPPTAPAAMPAAPGGMGAAPPGMAGDVPPPPPAPNGFTWTLPEGWKATGGSNMRLASFEVPLAEGGVGDCSIVRLGGQAGGFVANLNRWRGQLGLAPADEASLRAEMITGKAPVGEFAAFKFANPDNGKGMLATMYAHGDATLFVKLTAPAAALDGLMPTFLDFCASLAEGPK